MIWTAVQLLWARASRIGRLSFHKKGTHVYVPVFFMSFRFLADFVVSGGLGLFCFLFFLEFSRGPGGQSQSYRSH